MRSGAQHGNRVRGHGDRDSWSNASRWELQFREWSLRGDATGRIRTLEELRCRTAGVHLIAWRLDGFLGALRHS
jgi:hypothetical protein